MAFVCRSHAPQKGVLRDDDVKLRECLGWCGQKVKTTKTRRFCRECAARKEYNVTGIDGMEQTLRRSFGV